VEIPPSQREAGARCLDLSQRLSQPQVQSGAGGLRPPATKTRSWLSSMNNSRAPVAAPIAGEAIAYGNTADHGSR
jgi:hypothetical protein